jgi:hypothetical protein
MGEWVQHPPQALDDIVDTAAANEAPSDIGANLS